VGPLPQPVAGGRSPSVPDVQGDSGDGPEMEGIPFNLEQQAPGRLGRGRHGESLRRLHRLGIRHGTGHGVVARDRFGPKEPGLGSLAHPEGLGPLVRVAQLDLQVQDLLAHHLKPEVARFDHPRMDGADGDLVDPFPLDLRERVGRRGCRRSSIGATGGIRPEGARIGSAGEAHRVFLRHLPFEVGGCGQEGGQRGEGPRVRRQRRADPQPVGGSPGQQDRIQDHASFVTRFRPDAGQPHRKGLGRLRYSSGPPQGIGGEYPELVGRIPEGRPSRQPLDQLRFPVGLDHGRRQPARRPRRPGGLAVLGAAGRRHPFTTWTAP
jgi:hypothetical protein